MPIINVNVILKDEDRNEKKSFSSLAHRLTESTVRVLKKRKELVVVRINYDRSRTSWYEGGVLKEEGLFEIEIKITKGTNTSEEISTWTREAYESAIQELGTSEGPNYISVFQNDENSWGYNGLTQYGRKKWLA